MSVTHPRGFKAAGIAAGIKAIGRPDLAVVINEGPRHGAAGVFTSNRFQAAPVQWSQHVLADGQLTAVILNSGGANACTGAPGYADAARTAELVAAALGTSSSEVAVCSTGLIGVRLPMAAIESGVATIIPAANAEGGPDAARAIMTTDTVSKQAEFTAPAGWRIGGMAKGAGMLAPALATMLVVLTTDADVPSNMLEAALRSATSVTFDRTDSDGCMSTNDTVIAMASAASGLVPDAQQFTAALTQVCQDLARQLIADAEGAAHDIAITVSGAASETDALEVARAVARSNLFKCAIFGADPNWGRVLAAAGTARAAFDPDRVDVSFNGVMVFRQGGIGADRSLVDLAGRQVQVDVNLNNGESVATIWTNDLTFGYVKENAEYPS